MSDLNLRQLRYVVAMADTGTISSAARSLGVSQPALSTSLQEAEASMGVALFMRSHGRPLVLTAEGRALIPEIRRLVAQADELALRAAGLAAPTSGTVRLGTLVTIAPILLPPLLSAFRSVLPGATVSVTTADQATLLDQLRTGDLHMALTYDLSIDEGMEFSPIAVVPPRVLLSTSHPLSRRRSVRLQDLSGDPFVLLDLPLSADYFQAVFLAAGVSMRPAMRCVDLSFVRALVAENLGYSIVNLIPPKETEGLSYVPLDGDVPNLQIGLASADRTPPAAATEFRSMAGSLIPRLLKPRAPVRRQR